MESTTRYRRPLNPRKGGKSQAEPSATRRSGATRNAKHHGASASKSTDGQRANQSERQHRIPELPPPQASAPQILPPPMQSAYPTPEVMQYQMPPMDRMNQTLYFTWGDVTGFTDELPPYDGTTLYESTGVSPHWEGTMQMRPRF